MSLRRGLVDIGPLRTSAAFRRLWIGSGLSTMGGQFTVVAVLYQTWQLTGSAFAVGMIGLAQAVPSVIFGLVGGLLADAVDRRRLVALATLGQIVGAGLLAAQALANIGSVGLLLGIVVLQEACGGLGGPARRTFAVRLLPADQVSAGIALDLLSFQLAMLVGPSLAGLVTARWGVGGCYLVDAIAFCAGLYGMLGLPPMRPLGKVARPGLRAMARGLGFIARGPVLRGAFLTDLLATVLAMPIALFPLVNAERFGGNPQTLGLFLTAIAVGGIAVSTVSGYVTRSARPGIVMLAAVAVWGSGLAGFGLAGPLWLTLGCLALAGAADVVSVTSRGTVIQLATPDSYRGRVSAVERIIGKSGPEIGNFRAGLAAGATSASVAAVTGGAICVLGSAALAVTNGPLRRFRVSRNGAGEGPVQAPTSVSSAE